MFGFRSTVTLVDEKAAAGCRGVICKKRLRLEGSLLPPACLPLPRPARSLCLSARALSPCLASSSAFASSSLYPISLHLLRFLLRLCLSASSHPVPLLRLLTLASSDQLLCLAASPHSTLCNGLSSPDPSPSASASRLPRPSCSSSCAGILSREEVKEAQLPDPGEKIWTSDQQSLDWRRGGRHSISAIIGGITWRVYADPILRTRISCVVRFHPLRLVASRDGDSVLLASWECSALSSSPNKCAPLVAPYRFSVRQSVTKDP